MQAMAGESDGDVHKREETMAGLSRRSFVGTGAAGMAGTWLAGCTPHTPQAADNEPPARPEGLPLARPDGVDDPAWAHVRAAFIMEAGTAYMNNAGLGLPPGSVARAVADGYEAVSREPRRGTGELRNLVARRVRPGLAAFLGADEGELSLTRNATEALHLSAAGFDLRPGDEVVFTTQEHPAGRRPWQLRAARDGIVTREVFIPSPLPGPNEVARAFEAALTSRTRVLAFCHVTRGGHLYPVRRLAALARERGILTHVDGAQAVGMFPVHLHELGCDTYSASLHKWFLGPTGTGFLYVRASAREHIRSAFAHDATPENPAFEPPGTNDLPVRAALAASLAFMEQVGIDRIEARTRFLSDYLKERLAGMSGVRLVSGASPETSCPASTIFEMEGVDAVASVPVITERASIHIDEHRRDGHEAIRVSTHMYNTTAEIDRLVEALAGLRPA